MKIFGYEFRKFEKQNTVLPSAVETWVVKWYSHYYRWGDLEFSETRLRHQVFAEQEEALVFCEELKDAKRLIGDNEKSNPWVEKVDPPTNRN